MEKNVMNGKAWRNADGGKMVREHKPASRGQAAQRILMTTGAIDILGRTLGQKLAERLGQPVVPENRAGAGGNIAYEFVAKAKPDGYTLALGQTALVISPSLYKTLNYDPIKDFAPISLVAQTPFVLVVRSSLPVNSLKDLVDYAKVNPGKLNYGSTGIGATAHLAAELFKSLAKINIVHVPYKGAAQAMVGMLAGESDMQITALMNALPQIQADKARALVVLSTTRAPALPNVPTAKEAGIDNWEATSWFGLLAPAGTPRDIVKWLNAEWIKVAAMPDTKEQLQKIEFEPLSGTPEQLSEFLRAETERWAKVIKDANITKLD
jgi:tripartite-type tricarboxylate transporter receptor subunit TctC